MARHALRNEYIAARLALALQTVQSADGTQKFFPTSGGRFPGAAVVIFRDGTHLLSLPRRSIWLEAWVHRWCKHALARGVVPEVELTN